MKKTDLEMFIETYKQFGIDIKTYHDDDEIVVSLKGFYENPTKSEKLGGYSGCYSNVYFTKDGKFINQEFLDAE